MMQVQRARYTARDFFDDVRNWQARHGSPNGRLRQAVGWPDTLSEELRKLSTEIGRGAETVKTDEQKIELSAAQDRCDSLAASLATWQGQTTEESVYWIEVSEGSRPRVTLACAPLDVGPTLRRELFERVPTCILTSATLCVGAPPRFDFFKTRLGLTACESLQLGSPFDFPNQVTIHLPRNLPDPSEQPDAFERQAIDAITYYLDKTHGKAFVLFTSYRMMQAAVRALTPWFAQRNIALFALERPGCHGSEDGRGVQVRRE